MRQGFISTAFLLAAAGFLGSCQNTSNTGGGNGGPGSGPGSGGGSSTGSGGPVESFTPKGCSFTVTPRAEYLEFSLAESTTKASPNIRRVRLGLGGGVDTGKAGKADPATTAGFAWQTDDGTLASDVTWGSDPDPSKWPAANRTSGVTWLTPQGSIKPNGDQRMHEAYVCGLDPDSTHYYRVGGGPEGKEVWSDVHSFATTPTAGTGKVKIAVSGDSRGEQNNAWQVMQQRFALSGANLQLFSGDMIFLAPDQTEWEQWLDAASKDKSGKLLTLGQLLTLSAHGNHDNHTSLFFGNLVLPQDSKKYPAYGELFYSVDVGPAHIVVVDDAWIVFASGDPDYQNVLTNWLEADLKAANANRDKVPWIITMHHHPEFSSSTHGKDLDVVRGRTYFAPIWEKHHVDLAIAGHDHDYERSKPLTGPAENPTVHDDFKDGTVYLVCAGAGADPYPAGTSTFTETSHDFTGGGAIGIYAFLTATATTLEIEAHELRADGSDPMFDSVTIKK